jgi:hypothetical protein
VQGLDGFRRRFLDRIGHGQKPGEAAGWHCWNVADGVARVLPCSFGRRLPMAATEFFPRDKTTHRRRGAGSTLRLLVTCPRALLASIGRITLSRIRVAVRELFGKAGSTSNRSERYQRTLTNDTA